MTDNCGHCEEHMMDEIKKRLLQDSVISYNNYRHDIQFLLQELERKDEEILFLSAYGRLQQLKATFPSKREQNELGESVKNEWQQINAWHKGLRYDQMNWLNHKFAEARKQLEEEE